MIYFFGKSENEIRKIIGDKFKNRGYCVWDCNNPEERAFISLFHCNFAEFFECVRNYKQEQTKMTREEAKRRIKLISKESFTERQLDDFLNVLIELGAIKLDAPAYIQFVEAEDIDGDVQRIKTLNAIRALEAAGYCVYKKGGE